jgi:hypothetical protein
MKEIRTMDARTENQAGAADLYETTHQIDRSFCSIYEGGSGVGHLGDVIPFDDAAVFADMISGRDAYHSFRDVLEQSSGMTYRQLCDLDRDSVADLQRSLPPPTFMEILHRARAAKAAFQRTCRVLAAAIIDRLLEIKLDQGDGLTHENLAQSWHALCASHLSLRHLVSDLRDAAWLDHDDPWQDLDRRVVDAVLAMRECFDWDQMTSLRSGGRTPISWPLAPDNREQLEEAGALLSRANATWVSLRDRLIKKVSDDFEYFAGSRSENQNAATA